MAAASRSATALKTQYSLRNGAFPRLMKNAAAAAVGWENTVHASNFGKGVAGRALPPGPPNGRHQARIVRGSSGEDGDAVASPWTQPWWKQPESMCRLCGQEWELQNDILREHTALLQRIVESKKTHMHTIFHRVV